MRKLSVLLLLALCSPLIAATRPNILLVMVDDMGFSDLGCYGSEIDTPNMDKLAAGGVRFTQFYNTAKCHSSRVSLLTGRWCKQAGDVRLTRAVTIPEVLAPAGKVLAALDKTGIANNTLVVFTSDNGSWKQISQELEGKAHFPSE